MPPRRINEIVLKKRGITADTALRLARFFGTSAELWTGLQADYDLRLVRCKKARTIGDLLLRCLGCPVPEKEDVFRYLWVYGGIIPTAPLWLLFNQP